MLRQHILSLLFLFGSSIFAAPPLPDPPSPADPLPARHKPIARAVTDTFNDLLQGIGDTISTTDIQQNILPEFFDAIPSGDEIRNTLGLDDEAIAGMDLEFLNIPGYANFTSEGWNLRIHGQAYKEPLTNPERISNATLDRAANLFLPDLDVSQLQPHEQDNARNLTSAIFSLPQEGVPLRFTLDVMSGQNFSSNWTGEIAWATPTDPRGEVDGFAGLLARIPGDLPNGSTTREVVKLNVHTNDTDTGNATAYLVPTEGITILSDIDDILRVTKIYQPEEGLLNTFARDFVPWMNMPEIYADWSTQNPNNPYHFHYLTTTPEQATRVYMSFIYNHYPLGSFDTRPMNFTTVDQTFSIRLLLLRKIFETFPQRKFVLVGDTTNLDVMREYPSLVETFPGQVQCILLRNTSATDETNRLPYDTTAFRGLKQGTFMFFRTPEDLRGLNFANGDCMNADVQQNVTFGWQNLPFGFDDQASSGVEKDGPKLWMWWIWCVVCAIGVTMGL